MCKCSKTILLVCIALLIFLGLDKSSALENISTNPSFSDVPSDEWYFLSITEMSKRGIMVGYPDGKFRPKNIISRAEFARIMVSALGVDVYKTPVNIPSIFSDVAEGDWFFPYIEAVKPYMVGYREPNNTITFRPRKPILREDMVIALVKMKAYNTRVVDESILDVMFTDSNSISKYAKKYVAVAVESRLVSGYPDETFKAQNFLTRAEACALIWQAMQVGADNKVIIGDMPN